MNMSSRISLSRRCVLLKKVPDDVDEKYLDQCISGLENCHRHNEFSLEEPETRWIVLLKTVDEKLIKTEQVPVTTSNGKQWNLRVGGCPECIIPEVWIENVTPETWNAIEVPMEDSIGMDSVRHKEEVVQNGYKPDGSEEKGLHSSVLKGSDIYEKVEKPEEKNEDKYVPSFNIPAISSPYSPKWTNTDDSHQYTSFIEEENTRCTTIRTDNEPQTYSIIMALLLRVT